MDTVYPVSASALRRGRRLRTTDSRLRHRTQPVTFAEIKEVDEDNEEVFERGSASTVADERRRRPDVLNECLGRQFAEFRRRRARRNELQEKEDDDSTPSTSSTTTSAKIPATVPVTARTMSVPDALHNDTLFAQLSRHPPDI